MFTPTVRLPLLIPGGYFSLGVMKGEAENSAGVDETGTADGGGGGCCWCRLLWRLWWNILNTSGCEVDGSCAVLVGLVYYVDGKTELRWLSTNVFTIDRFTFGTMVTPYNLERFSDVRNFSRMKYIILLKVAKATKLRRFFFSPKWSGIWY